MGYMKFEDFLNQNPHLKVGEMHGPPAPFDPARDQPNIRRKPVGGKVKIPKPGPMNPPGTKPTPRKKTKGTALNIQGNQSFEPITQQLLHRNERLKLKSNLEDRLQDAIASQDRKEQTRLMRLMRNIEELRKAKKRPYGSSVVTEELERKIQRDIAADPQRTMARSLIDKTFGLEVDPMYDLSVGGKSRIYADSVNEHTAKRVASGRTAMLADMPTEKFPVNFRPINKEQRAAARTRYQQARATDKAAKDFLNDVMRDSGTGMGVPYKIKVGKKMPPMLEGMENTGLPMGSNQRASAVKQAIANLEVDSLNIAGPADELTRLSVAEGRSNLLGNIKVNLPYDAMPVTPAGNFSMFPRGEKLPKGVHGPVYSPMDEVFRQEEKILREQLKEQRKIKFKQLDEMYKYDLFFRRQLDRNTEVMSRTRSIMPPMLDRPTIHRPIINAGAQKRLDSFKRAQEARVSTQGGQNTPIQQADSITPPPRSSSRVAQMLGEDTVRAASVIHSSKMNYATVGLAGMAAVFGIASASRQRKNIEQEIQSR